ncbi:MAG: FAD-dependent oxidoreductase [Pseudomonadota bacterium]
MKRVAVIGAGLSGLVLARELGTAHDVTVFEKSARLGGRLASREAGPWTFDHGAQFFVRRGRAARALLDALEAAGAIAAWRASFREFNGTTVSAQRDWTEEYPHYVGMPSMRSIGEWLARDVRVVLDTPVTEVSEAANGWHVHGADGEALGHFDWVVTTAPGPQSAALVAAEPLNERTHGQPPMRACNALMLGFDEPQALDWQAALVRNANISWMSVNSSKPGRDEPFSMVVLSTNAWADAHLDWPDDKVAEFVLEEAARVGGIDPGAAVHVAIKRWRYANVARQATASYYLDAQRGVAACGDWFVQGRVEGAVASASALAAALLA